MRNYLDLLLVNALDNLNKQIDFNLQLIITLAYVFIMINNIIMLFFIFI